MIDGCSRLEALRKVILPLSLPGVGAVTIYSAILSWCEFLFARTFVYMPKHWVITVGLVSFVSEHAVDWTGLMAAGIVSVVPMVVVFVLLEPLLVRGLTAGAVRE